MLRPPFGFRCLSPTFAFVLRHLIRPWLSTLRVFAVAGIVCCLYFQELMLTPNAKSPTFGGDGLTIHYNLQYHATYGEGSALTSQYHPYEESIFMTDAHALLAVVFAALRPVLPGLAEYSSGIANFLVFWSNPLAVVFLFLTFRRLRVGWGFSLVFSLLIALMSPQILRQLGGQYTLGFTWMLPYVIWYLAAWDPDKRYWPKTLALTLTIYLLGLNNPYMYAVSGAFVLAASGVAVLFRLFGDTAIAWVRIGHWLTVFVVSTGAVFLTLSAFDTVDDRVEVPFGFFHNIAYWGGLLTSQDVLLYDWLRQVFPALKVPKHEHQLYLGLVPILCAVSLPFILALPTLRKRFWAIRAPSSSVISNSSLASAQRPSDASPLPRKGAGGEAHLLLFGLTAGLAGLLFGFGLPFSYFKYWSYEHLGAVLQFRAPVRFGWPLYYMLGITAGYVLSRIWSWGILGGNDKRQRIWARPLVLGLLLTWAVEAHQFLTGHLVNHVHGNPFRKEKLDDYQDVLTTANITADAYSSIFLLPTELGWTDKIHHDGIWRSNHDGYQLSLVTGLPLLNGKLSRLSLARCLLSLQMTTDPLVRKDLLDQIDTSKHILLLAAPDQNLNPPERRLRELGLPLYKDDKRELLGLDPAILHREHIAAVAAVAKDTTLTDEYYRFAYEYNEDQAFYGKGSQRVGKNWQDVFQLPVDSLRGEGPYHVSFWAYTDGSRFGGPKFYLKLEDAAGAKISEQYQWANTVYETQRGWQRIAFDLDVPAEARTLKLISNYDHPYYIDEVLIRPAGRSVLVAEAGGRLFNNYWVN